MDSIARVEVKRQRETDHIQCGALCYHFECGGWLSRAGAEYALERLWQIVAGSLENLEGVRTAIEIPACTLADVQRLVALEPGKLRTFASTEVLPAGSNALKPETELPAFVSLGPTAPARLVERIASDRVRVHLDLVAMTFFMLTRWEEIDSTSTDEHGRFPACDSTAEKQGFLAQPVVDQWAVVLRSWVQTLCPAWNPVNRTTRMHLSCDVDHPLRYPSLMAVARKVCGTIARSHRPIPEALRTLHEGICSLRDWRQDPNFKTLQWLLDLGDRLGSPIAFFFMTADSSSYDEGYDLAVHPYDQLLREVVRRNQEVGFHPGYSTHGDADELERQRARLIELCPLTIRGGRQHYLRFKVPDTWRMWAAAGMSYDSTLTYSEAPGFRCGTCHPYPVFDARIDERIDLVEIPLVAMDASFDVHLDSEVASMKAKLLRLMASCREVDGDFTLLIHNDVRRSKRDAISEVVMAYQAEMPDEADVLDQRIPADAGAVRPDIRTTNVA